MADGSGTPTGGRSVRLRLEPWSIVRSVLLVAVWVLGLALVSAAETALWWIGISAVIAAAALPAVRVFRRRMPAWLAVTLVVLVVLVGGAALAVRVLAEVNTEIGVLEVRAVQAAADLEASEQFGQVASQLSLRDRVSDFFFGLPVVLGGGDVGTVVNAVTENAGAVAAIGFLTLLFIVSLPTFVEAGLAQLDLGPAERMRALVSTAYRSAGRYAWWMAVRAFAVGIVVEVVALALDAPAPTAIACWFALWSLVPALGLVVAALPIVLALLPSSLLAAASVLVVVVVVQALDVVWVQKRIESASLHVGPALTLLTVFVGAQLRGVGGVLVALAALFGTLGVLRALAQRASDVPTAVADLIDADADAIPGSALPGAGP